MAFQDLSPLNSYTPFIDLNVYSYDQVVFENDNYLPELKVGYEEIVHSSFNDSPTPPSPIYEDITDDEDESIDSVYNNLPKCIAEWNSDHIMKWILELYDSEDYRYEDLNLHHFKNRDGMYLMQMTEADWEIIDKNRSKWLYEHVQRFIQLSNTNSLTQSNEVTSTQLDHITSDEEITPNLPRRRGRPRKLTAKRRPEEKIGRVWEFLRNLLKNPEYCPSLIYWEDYSTKKFRLVDGQKVAELWGRKKNNPNMNYEKFSRTIRHYYKDNVIISVPKEKLVYRFGENARGIETDNPNFGINVNR